jgi:hypothetical protein
LHIISALHPDRGLTVTQANTCKQQGTRDFEIRLR